MTEEISFLGVIPARGGSKGIPGKNIKLLNGKPLIHWTIEHALKSKRLTKSIVTTDDENISTISQQKEIEVLERPSNLATDDSLIIDTLKHVLEHYPAKNIVLLQPTSPIRNPRTIDFCIETFIYNQDKFDAVVTGFMCNKFEYSPSFIQPRQKLKSYFYDDGNTYVIKSEQIKKGILKPKKYKPVFSNEYERHEIDTPFDFWLAEKILKEKYKY